MAWFLGGEVDERRARWGVRVAGAAVVGLALALRAVAPTLPVHHNLPGLNNVMVGFELATTPDQVFALLGRPGDADRDATVRAMDLANRVDLLFLVAYPALFLWMALHLEARGLAPRGLVVAMGVLACAMSAADAAENVQLLTLSGMTAPEAMYEPLGRLRGATAVKWGALYTAAGVIAPFVWRDPRRWRWAAAPFAVAAGLGASGIWWMPGIAHGATAIAVAWLATITQAWMPDRSDTGRASG